MTTPDRASSRLSPVVITAAGNLWPLDDPRPHHVDWWAISDQLARICRWAGAVQSHYSVAQHSVIVAEQLHPELRIYGLLHDAHEVVTGDVTSPVKALLRELDGGNALRQLESRIDTAIHAAAGLPGLPDPSTAGLVKQADRRALATEHRDLVTDHTDRKWLPDLPDPLPYVIRPLAWPAAADQFMDRLHRWLPHNCPIPLKRSA